jgi:hypothetical protein
MALWPLFPRNGDGSDGHLADDLDVDVVDVGVVAEVHFRIVVLVEQEKTDVAFKKFFEAV